jgi:hypothetical protein
LTFHAEAVVLVTAARTVHALAALAVVCARTFHEDDVLWLA